MANIYQEALNTKFTCIMNVIARQHGYERDLSGLTVEARAEIRNLAEQAIIDWATARRNGFQKAIPLTNLQHLLHEYCSIADHI